MRSGVLKSAFALLLLALSVSLVIAPFRDARAQPDAERPASQARLEWFDAGSPGAWTSSVPPDIGSSCGVVLLVHGLDEPGTVWDALAPELAARDLTSVRFEYPNDQAIALSAEQLGTAMVSLRESGVTDLWLVAHSMGGLVTLDALTREGFDRARWPGVRRVMTLGTPMDGSLLAPVRFIAEWREHAMRAMQEGRLDEGTLEGMTTDGTGEAGRDLTPGSVFLVELNARDWPAEIPITAIVAEVPKVDARGIENAILSSMPAPVAGQPEAAQSARAIGAWASRWLGEAIDLVGDGVVDADSGRSAWTDDIVPVRALHRSMITRVPCPVRGDDEPPAIAIVLQRIEEDLERSR